MLLLSPHGTRSIIHDDSSVPENELSITGLWEAVPGESERRREVTCCHGDMANEGMRNTHTHLTHTHTVPLPGP